MPCMISSLAGSSPSSCTAVCDGWCSAGLPGSVERGVAPEPFAASFGRCEDASALTTVSAFA
eukprot:4508111-Prymnesium_polylepis.1